MQEIIILLTTPTSLEKIAQVGMHDSSQIFQPFPKHARSKRPAKSLDP